MDAWLDDKGKNGWMDRQMKEQRRRDECMDRNMDGWMDGQKRAMK